MPGLLLILEAVANEYEAVAERMEGKQNNPTIKQSKLTTQQSNNPKPFLCKVENHASN
jgi:hypothetical protein